MAKRDIPQADLDRAGELLNEGASFRAAARETNISTDTLKRRFPGAGHAPSSRRAGGGDQAEHDGARRRRDPSPKPRGGRPRRAGATKVGPTDEQLEGMLRKVAIAPSIPMRLWVHCDYCTMHFVTQGPIVARQLVELSRDYPELREMLESLWGSWEKYVWAGVLAAYLGVPLMHHVAPAGLYSMLAPLAGMPPKAPPAPAGPVHRHDPPAPEAETAAAAEPVDMFAGSPLAGLNVDELLAQAEAMGMQVLDEILVGLGKLPANGSTPDTAEPAEPDTAAGLEADSAEPEAPAATADPDTELD